MDKRKHTRIKTRQYAKISGKLAVLMDMSQTGLQVSTALLPKRRAIDITLEANGEIFNLAGTVQWIRRKNSLNSLNRFGVFIPEPPPAYRELLHRLSH